MCVCVCIYICIYIYIYVYIYIGGMPFAPAHAQVSELDIQQQAAR